MATLRVTYKKSTIGYSQAQKDTVRSLGLRKLHQVVELPDNPSMRGMIFKVKHLLHVEEIATQAASSAPAAPPVPQVRYIDETAMAPAVETATVADVEAIIAPEVPA